MSDISALEKLLAAALAKIYETFQHPASCELAAPRRGLHGQTAPLCTCGLTNALLTLEALAPDMARAGQALAEALVARCDYHASHPLVKLSDHDSDASSHDIRDLYRDHDSTPFYASCGLTYMERQYLATWWALGEAEEGRDGS